MANMTRLPAVPLVANDPYFSIWSAYDHLTDGDTTHWAGACKRLYGEVRTGGKAYRFLGAGELPAAEQTGLTVTATRSAYGFKAGECEFSVMFETPALPEDMDLLSAPVTFVCFKVHKGEAEFCFRAYDDICYDGDVRPEMLADTYAIDGLNIALTGRRRQNLLCHSGDHITIDWGYLYMASRAKVEFCEDYLQTTLNIAAGGKNLLMLAYDDVASINYFGYIAKAWYARNGASIVDVLRALDKDETIHDRCAEFDSVLHRVSVARGGEDYAYITAAAYRHTIAAHKLIADENGEMVLLSKENDSNGCIGTVDVSYPSIPLFLLLKPELVRALCRPVLKFARMPIWEFDFAPHDVGRYPQAIGQIYAARNDRKGIGRINEGDVCPPMYLYPAGTDAYDFRYQMPVEECGNMLVMMAAAAYADGNYEYCAENMDLLEKWVKYLIEFGEDPGDQLCTDDFAGHLAHNINLSAKAIVGVKCFARILTGLNDFECAAEYDEKAAGMMQSWLERAKTAEGHTALTFDGEGWSMKYNLAWDKVMHLGLLPDEFYSAETKSYLPRINEFGLPLDSRRTYTKSDWELWCAAMADPEDFPAFIKPIVHYLRSTESRVAFSDWYDTVTGRYEHFIARSVQGGLFMPLLIPVKQ